MKEIPTDDPLFGKGMIRIDGRAIHPAYLFEVKTPAESKYPWDYYKLVATIPGGRGVPAALGKRVPAGEEVTDCPAGPMPAGYPSLPWQSSPKDRSICKLSTHSSWWD